MKKTKQEVLVCVTPKDDSNLSNYNKPYVEKNSFSIQDDKLYVRYDNDELIQVPGYYQGAEFKESNYIISKEKTVFSFKKNEEQYLVYSDDMGKNWQIVPINKQYGIASIQFLDSNVGYMLEFEDYAMGSIAAGKLLKTNDGGKTWTEIFHGIGEEPETVFCKGSEIKFIDETVGFLTMPSITGEYSELYRTEDGGITFSKLEIAEDKIYDFYTLPYKNDNALSITIYQGTDGDKFITYYSEDIGKSWQKF